MSKAVRTTRFATTVVADVRRAEACDHTFDRIEPVDPRRGFDFSVETSSVGEIMIADVRHGEGVRITSRDSDNFAFVIPGRGAARGRVGDSWVTLDRRHGAVFNPDDVRDLVWEPRTEVALVYLPERLITDFVASQDPTRDPQPVTFERSVDLDAPAVRTWRRLVALLRDEMRSGSPLLDSPLAAGQIERTMVAGLLAALPNSTSLSPVRGTATSSSRTVTRTLDLIEERPDHPWRVEGLAAEVGVSARTLQDAFRREQGSTPLRELRRIRLERAHAELLAGDPATTSVTEVALRWGFPHLGRFSQVYRTTHGRLPSATLAGERVSAD